MLTQVFESPENWYTLEFPRVWDVEIVDNIPAFFDPILGKGALQVLSVKMKGEGATKELLEAHPYLGGANLKEKMSIFLHTCSVAVSIDDLQEVEIDGTTLLPYEYSIDGRFYMCVMIQKNNIFLLCLYNSDAIPDEADAQIISNIIKSIKIVEN